MLTHKFKKDSNTVYLFSVYDKDGGEYKIFSVDRFINGTLKRVYEVKSEDGEVVGTLFRLKVPKTSYEME